MILLEEIYFWDKRTHKEDDKNKVRMKIRRENIQINVASKQQRRPCVTHFSKMNAYICEQKNLIGAYTMNTLEQVLCLKPQTLGTTTYRKNKGVLMAQ
jgi:hypothetical protein